MKKVIKSEFQMLPLWISIEDEKVTEISFSEIKENELASQTEPVIIELNEYFNHEREKFNVALNLKGTPFQIKVWNELLKIPYGQTVSYSDIAERINHPKAVRAVGTAIGKNPIPIIVPCHRVIGKHGNIGGYSGGLHIKRLLMEVESIEQK